MPVSTTMTYILHRVTDGIGALRKIISERSFKNPTSTFAFKSHINNFCRSSVCSLPISSQRILNCQALMAWIWRDLLFYGSWITFFRHVCIILASDCQRSIQCLGTKRFIGATTRAIFRSILLAPSAYSSIRLCYTRSHVGVSCIISSCTWYVICKILIVILVAVTNEQKKHCQYGYTYVDLKGKTNHMIKSRVYIMVSISS